MHFQAFNDSTMILHSRYVHTARTCVCIPWLNNLRQLTERCQSQQSCMETPRKRFCSTLSWNTMQMILWLHATYPPCFYSAPLKWPWHFKALWPTDYWTVLHKARWNVHGPMVGTKWLLLVLSVHTDPRRPDSFGIKCFNDFYRTC